MNNATQTEPKNTTAKAIAKRLRNNYYSFSATARGERVFVRTDLPTWLVCDLLPPGWGVRQVTDKYDVLVVSWVG